jgi:hypothetical protein
LGWSCPSGRPDASQPAAGTIGLIFAGALSASFDQDRSYASAVIIKMPTMLTTICIGRPKARLVLLFDILFCGFVI